MDIQAQKGIVVFLDILGYQSFLDSNASLGVTRKVIQTIAELPQVVFDITKTVSTSEAVQPLFKTLVFSDTIVITRSCHGGEVSDWLATIYHVGTVVRRLFDLGLPVRGAIDFGEFYQAEYCFAGEAIANAYKQSSVLDLATCVFTPRAADQCRKTILEDTHKERLSNVTKVLPHLMFNYLTPIKNEERRLWHLNFPFHDFAQLGIKPWDENFDPNDKVAKCFLSHHKDISKTVESKYKNTEMLLRFVKHRVGITRTSNIDGEL